jgi:hypothetical protein
MKETNVDVNINLANTLNKIIKDINCQYNLKLCIELNNLLFIDLYPMANELLYIDL